MDAIQEYARALDGIDHVIEVCEQKAALIRGATSRWKLDITGSSRTEAGSEDDHLMTPVSPGARENSWSFQSRRNHPR